MLWRHKISNFLCLPSFSKKIYALIQCRNIEKMFKDFQEFSFMEIYFLELRETKFYKSPISNNIILCVILFLKVVNVPGRLFDTLEYLDRLTLPKDPWPRTLRRSNCSGDAFSQPSRVMSLTSISDTMGFDWKNDTNYN